MFEDRDACYQAVLTRDARFDGRFYTGVRTTGIYCRPVCPARPPKLENIIFTPSAAAAEAAGLRPCLRCRPETSPDIAAWHGSANSVARAMRLIEHGALNGGNAAGLAAKLGLGERQLRRLFQKHLGASPKAVAQTRRGLFARQLLHETKLSMTDVALAAGFGSVRRFNDEFRKHYGQQPQALRRLGAATATGTAVTLSLAYRPPYDWPAMLGFLAARAIPGVEQVAADSYRRSITLRGQHGMIDIRPGRGAALEARINFPEIRALPEIVARIRQMFDLGADTTMIEHHLAADPVLAALVARHPGLRVPGAWDGFELAVRAILGQQITVSAATKLAGKLVSVFGAKTQMGDADIQYLFPTPEVLAGADIAAAVGMPAARTAAIATLAQAMLVPPGVLTAGAGLAASVARLRELPCIGEWSGQYIAMRALREPDAFPAADIGLLRAMTDGGGRPTPAQLLARAEAWRPWRAYAALHLWTSLNADSPKESPVEIAA